MAPPTHPSERVPQESAAAIEGCCLMAGPSIQPQEFEAEAMAQLTSFFGEDSSKWNAKKPFVNGGKRGIEGRS
jgi:hypothetical protein